METIREITSFSHDGLDYMWYPFSATLGPNNSVISAEHYYEIGELLRFLNMIFGTNNHHPEVVNRENIGNSVRFLIGDKPQRTLCSISFRTDKSEYKMQRYFIGEYSVEAKLQKIGTSIVYHGQDVIQVLCKLRKPFIVGNDRLFINNSIIFKPIDNYSRSSMIALANNWARMIGFQDSRIGLDYAGKWSIPSETESSSSSRRYVRSLVCSSPLRILTNLAQAVMRKRTYGTCVPIFCSFNLESLNEFESIAMLDLIKNVSIEEGLQFIVGINSKPQINSMIDTIETPNLSIYEAD
ncbi:MAG: hypothetical protein MKZ58_06565 [Candidatus Poseidoniaceae archaeon]|nr:hypothetical protein [Candidatus Poseidoniaceae archaeon]